MKRQQVTWVPFFSFVTLAGSHAHKMITPSPTTFSTVSSRFIDDWLDALRSLCSNAQMVSLMERSDLVADRTQPYGRVTLDQIVCLYQLAAIETGDEMMGLWSRPIRPRALQHLLTSVREATSLPSALYRFSTFWNLLLDEYQFDLTESDTALVLTLTPLHDAQVRPFGHMLILKLAHGLLSWLAGHELPVKGVEFAFERPEFDQDYAIIFPAPLIFARPATAISFDPRLLGPVEPRTTSDLDHFLQNAPRDWIFTRSREHTQSLRVRTFLSHTDWDKATLTHAAQAMNMTRRTLIRRLDEDGTSFQAIKDALRRDIAIRDLQAGRKSIEAIALDVGFSSAANFHRAFQRWTGSTPSSYRRRQP
jgi:AraC-like DNA-binding protein